MTTTEDGNPLLVVKRLQRALNACDLEALLACFTGDYLSEQPLHPDRTFRGVEQVRANWTAIFKDVKNFRAELIRSAVEGDTGWAEWHWSGTQVDGGQLDIRGVTIFGVQQGRIAWGRLFMDPVAAGGGGINAAVREMTRRANP